MSPALRERILAIAPSEREDWVNAYLGIEGASPDDEPLPRGAVPYLPCAVEEILVLADELGPDDRLVDLGAGLGRVVILAHLLTGAQGHGIEIQPGLVNAARAIALRVGAEVTFAHGDASEADLEGTVFFLYAPFNGAMMTRVLSRLRAVAERHPIRVCAVGCEFRGLDWLVPRASPSPSTLIYESR